MCRLYWEVSGIIRDVRNTASFRRMRTKVEPEPLLLGVSLLLREKVELDDERLGEQVRRSKATVPRMGVMCEDW